MTLLGDYIELKQIDIISKKDMLVFNAQNFYSFIFNHENLVVTIRGNLNKLEEIKYISSNCEEFLNYKQKDLISQKLNILIPEPIASCHETYLKKYLETGYTTKIDVIQNSILLRKHDDPIFVSLFVKYYPSLSNEIYFTGVFSKSELKNALIIIDKQFNINYIASLISNELNFNLNIFKKLKLDIPFYLICPNILKFFRISSNKIHNKTNKEGDLNQVVLDFYIPPFVDALMKEIANMKNSAVDSEANEEEEENHAVQKRTTKKFEMDNLVLQKDKLIMSYRNILNKLHSLYLNEDFDNISVVIKTLYNLTFPQSSEIMICKKAKIDFTNFNYRADQNLIICDIKIIGNGIVGKIDDIFVQELDLDDLMFQGKFFN